MDYSPYVVIVIVHWKNLVDTAECLGSLCRLDYDSYDVLVVNNGSPDFDQSVLRQVFPRCIVLESPTNLGFTGGNNLGIVDAIKRGADYILLLNPDTVVQPNLLSTLIPVMEREGAGIGGPVISFEPDRDRIWFAGGIYCSRIGFSYRERPMATFAGWRNTTWLNGCAFLMRRSVVEQIGLLWDGLYLYCDDLEFCLRAREAGFRCIQVGAALVHHKISASSGQRGRDQLSPLKSYYFARNYLLVLKRHTRGLTRITALCSQFTILLAYQIPGMTRSQDSIAVLKNYMRGLWHGLKGVEGPMPQ